MICRTAVELACRSLDVPLSVSERAGLGIHTLFCGPCRRFRQQLICLDAACEAATTRTARDAPPVGEALSPATRERIATALDRTPAD